VEKNPFLAPNKKLSCKKILNVKFRTVPTNLLNPRDTNTPHTEGGTEGGADESEHRGLVMMIAFIITLGERM